MKLLSIAEQAVSSEEDFVSLSGEFDQDFGGILDRRRGIIRPATNMKTLNVLNDNAKNCLANCKIEIIDKNAAEKLVPHIHMPFNLAFYMPEAINVNSKYYLNALFLACQNIVKELSASGFGKKNLCLQKKSVYELRELEGEYDAVIICLGAKADLLPELAGKLPLRTCRGVILHLQLPDNIG